MVFLTIFVAFCLLYFLIPQKYVGWLFFTTTLALAIMAFNCVPKETDDLSNYFWQLDTLRKGGWDTFQTMLKDDNNHWGALPVCGYYFYLVSLLGNNGFLPAITIFVAYGAMFYVFYKASVRFAINKWYLFLCCVFALVTYWFYDLCSGIRNGLAFTLFTACVYQDVVEKKYRYLCYIGYALCIGLHSSTIVFAVMRLALVITKKHGSKLISWLMVFSISIGGNILLWLGEHTDIAYLQLLSEKADKNVGRFIGTGETTQVYVNLIVFFVTAIWSIYLSKYIKDFNKGDEFKDFNKFYVILMFFVAGCVTSGLLFVRMVRWVIPAICSLFFMIGMQACHNKQKAILNVENSTSVIRNQDSVLALNELIITVLFIAFTVVHLWYACNGTSLIWLHFK